MAVSKAVPCEYCAGRVRSRVITVDLRRGRNLVVVHHVPAYVCDRCGYREFGPDVAGKLQRVLAGSVKARRKVQVPVLEFDAVA